MQQLQILSSKISLFDCFTIIWYCEFISQLRNDSCVAFWCDACWCLSMGPSAVVLVCLLVGPGRKVLFQQYPGQDGQSGKHILLVSLPACNFSIFCFAVSLRHDHSYCRNNLVMMNSHLPPDCNPNTWPPITNACWLSQFKKGSCRTSLSKTYVQYWISKYGSPAKLNHSI